MRHARVQAADGSVSPDDPCLKLYTASPGAAVGAHSKTDRQCFAGPGKFDWRLLLESGGAGGATCACAHLKYDPTPDWDEKAADLACDGKPDCKVCGGYGRVEAACTANPQCGGFVMEPKTTSSYGWWYTCGSLKAKASMRDQASRAQLAERKDASGWRQGYDTFAKAW